MTWVRVNCSGGARYAAPSFSEVPALEGFPQLMKYPRQLKSIQLFPPAGKTGGVEEETTMLRVVGEQEELGGRLGLVTVIAGGDSEVSEQQLYLLIQYTFFILRRTDSSGAQALLDAITTHLPRADLHEAVKDRNHFLWNLRETRQRDDVEGFYSDAPQHKNRHLPLQSLNENSGDGIRSTGYKNREFLQSICGSGSREAPPPTRKPVSVTSPVPSPIATASSFLTRPKALLRKGFLHFVLQDTVPLSLLFSRVVLVEKRSSVKRREMKSAENPSTTPVLTATEQYRTGAVSHHSTLNDSSTKRKHFFSKNKPLNEGEKSGDNTKHDSSDPHSGSVDPNEDKAGWEVMCESRLQGNSNFTEAVSTLRDNHQSAHSVLDRSSYWNEFTLNCSEVNTRLLKSIQRLLLEVYQDNGSSSALINETISYRMWNKEGPGWKTSKGGVWSFDGLAWPFVAACSPSGLLFASPYFFTQLNHSERFLLTSSAISRLCSYVPSPPSEGLFHSYGFPLQAGFNLQSPFLNVIYDVFFLCVGDSLCALFGFPRRDGRPAPPHPTATGGSSSSGAGVPESTFPPPRTTLEEIFTVEKLKRYFEKHFIEHHNNSSAGDLDQDDGSSNRGSSTHRQPRFSPTSRLARQMSVLCQKGTEITLDQPHHTSSMEDDFEDALLTLNAAEDFFYNHNMLPSCSPRKKRNKNGKAVYSGGEGWTASHHVSESPYDNDFFVNFLDAVDDDDNGIQDPVIHSGIGISVTPGESDFTKKKKKKKMTSKIKKGTSNKLVSLLVMCCGKGNQKNKLLIDDIIDEGRGYRITSQQALPNKNNTNISLENSIGSTVCGHNAISFLPISLLFIYVASMVTREELRCFTPFCNLKQSVHSLFWSAKHVSCTTDEDEEGGGPIGKEKVDRMGNMAPSMTSSPGWGVAANCNTNPLTRNKNVVLLGQYSLSYFRPQMSLVCVDPPSSTDNTTLYSRHSGLLSPHTLYAVVHQPSRLLFYFNTERVYQPTRAEGKEENEGWDGKKKKRSFRKKNKRGYRGDESDTDGEKGTPGDRFALFFADHQVTTLPEDTLNSVTPLPPHLQDHYTRFYRGGASSPDHPSSSSSSSSSSEDEDCGGESCSLKAIHVNYPLKVSLRKSALVKHIFSPSTTNSSPDRSPLSQLSLVAPDFDIEESCWLNVECLLTLRERSPSLQADISSSFLSPEAMPQDVMGSGGVAEHNLISCIQSRKAHMNSAMKKELERLGEGDSGNRKEDKLRYLVEARDGGPIRFYNNLNVFQYRMLCEEVVLIQSAIHAFVEDICYN